ncbi:hypothetical protein AN4999.2 [Aspergillus nidulans FGSC A4]|uniref:Uncharacterized protein n=1 Tax=Emericella nidulans (strain FGSC A4 / ATCC 38163 / CBS 112.46 / NRRL 194 / M139) TaxID=227321 RepID=Q5B381_EMENI|nr:hypothetical protein [Aspergillus nidulans FGSC A4]EAA61077.1 hypothetical protein AN4999.2 [Aspergillus nidulans FGSC A4]CBF76312.1 TPA: hypothetical protein ANIA_04999 [Aspergillus nidulans FGSC A4]|eukprot:XP_662603.1 hypothetical protein AN4999.2 [Aspergillus nidulans FGSC A4]
MRQATNSRTERYYAISNTLLTIATDSRLYSEKAITAIEAIKLVPLSALTTATRTEVDALILTPLKRSQKDGSYPRFSGKSWSISLSIACCCRAAKFFAEDRGATCTKYCVESVVSEFNTEMTSVVVESQYREPVRKNTA